MKTRADGLRYAGVARTGVPPGTAGTLFVCGIGMLVCTTALSQTTLTAPTVPELPLAPVLAGLVWLIIAATVLHFATRAALQSFGAANTITTLRAAVTAALAGLLPIAHALPAGGYWAITAAAAAALLLDGVDGPVARRRGETSSFGARYDMEIDALLAAVMALLLWRSGELGAWVLALGALRYVFLAAALVLPALRAPLFPSLRRKTVCVVQIAVLAAALAPIVEPPLSSALAALALAALAGSFARDVLWLLRRPAPATSVTP